MKGSIPASFPPELEREMEAFFANADESKLMKHNFDKHAREDVSSRYKSFLRANQDGLGWWWKAR